MNDSKKIGKKVRKNLPLTRSRPRARVVVHSLFCVISLRNETFSQLLCSSVVTDIAHAVGKADPPSNFLIRFFEPEQLEEQ
ncbi:hypothetical protein Y032_0408g915 [Ancylostoma ceylanicum]|uniref:Uncharacterized protein n=1 Tax=Ancylostoma ceylanicum TaxID=53326 RepID=A0A016X4D3_9BILA|nr:hypothetical protein Y032_0408g915 [Ancylostoma ceylanicum]